jgi:micrococcal nuclease
MWRRGPPASARRFFRAHRTRRQWRRQIADPLFYLRAVIVVAGLALVAVPAATDGLLALTKPLQGGDGPCRILRVVDGDTLTIWCTATGMERARLQGFDAPELFSPGCAEELLAGQKAKWALRGMVLGADRLRIARGGMDRYDRRLVTMWVDGQPLARRMVQAGHARAYGGEMRDGWCG